MSTYMTTSRMTGGTINLNTYASHYGTSSLSSGTPPNGVYGVSSDEAPNRTHYKAPCACHCHQ
jgi:hypothetical protein